jgi:hypothetical protein
MSQRNIPGVAFLQHVSHWVCPALPLPDVRLLHCRVSKVSEGSKVIADRPVLRRRGADKEGAKALVDGNPIGLWEVWIRIELRAVPGSVGNVPAGPLLTRSAGGYRLRRKGPPERPMVL